ncbi:probable membrane-associated kinase regulator 2 [Manihot esculenta]|uniref:Membrane-associated kinase regulator 5 n=1 Tax=Manihot esculenta TaxID=3983 RepID=A0A2C9UHY8_MANES|nr:probable membrane-associated kinase regulator 2 [Manihot esculenta]OAY30315.1 hypothetical protein MANES_14G020600v8 [Manihot esculenta]
MEALYFFKFWRPNKNYLPSNGNSDTTEMATTGVDTDDELNEEEDSFFELEFTVPDFDNNKCENKNGIPLDSDSNTFDSKQKTLHNSANKAGNIEHKFPPPTVSLSPTDLLSKRKILPVEPISKPQSPISPLKSAPSFRVLMFKKSKSMAEHEAGKTGEAELKGVFVDTPKNKKQESKLFTVKFKLKEAANVPMFTRENSLRKQISDDSFPNDSSRRFSKEVIQKYLKLIKPLYIKVSKRQSNKPKFSGELSAPSPSSSPATLPSGSPKEKQGSIPAGIRVVCKHLGKSKSASAATTVLPSTVTRRDDSLLLQHDGIQSAILHCKRSFNSYSSRDSSFLSQYEGDTLNDKSMDSPRISHEEKGVH